MPTVTTEVYVDLDEFSTDEIANELSRRITDSSLSRKKIERMKDDLEALLQKFSLGEKGLPVKTLDDKQKIEHLSKVWDKYTSWQIENLLP